jgi:hypothetical protein
MTEDGSWTLPEEEEEVSCSFKSIIDWPTGEIVVVSPYQSPTQMVFHVWGLFGAFSWQCSDQCTMILMM